MLLVYTAAGLAIALLAYQLMRRHHARSHKRRLAGVLAAGVALNERGTVNASTTLANLLAKEKLSGEMLAGKQAEFKELLRMITQGPANIEEIRYLIRAGFEPVVRPDGKVYVPCEENEHLYMDGELRLVEEDLEPCTGIE